MSEGDGDQDRSPAAAIVARALHERRRALQWLLLPAAQLLASIPAWATAARIASARLWPAEEYTRLILEAPTALPHQLIVLADPHRIVLDLEGVELTSELQQLGSRVQASDPYIAGIRFGKQPPDILRLVVDLRTE